MAGDVGLDLLDGERALLQAVGLGLAGVKRVPVRPLASMTPDTRIVISESIHDDVPNRPIAFDQKRFGQRYPELVDNKVTTTEIRNLEVFSLTDGRGVVGQAAEQCPGVCAFGESTLPPTSADRTTNIEWMDRPCLVQICKRPIDGEWSPIVDQIDSCAKERLGRRQLMRIAGQQLSDYALSQTALFQRIERLWGQGALFATRPPHNARDPRRMMSALS